MTQSKRREADEQEDVLAKKDHVTEGSRGLQQWGDEATPDGPIGPGTGSAGTAERAARITEAQREAERRRKRSEEG